MELIEPKQVTLTIEEKYYENDKGTSVVQRKIAGGFTEPCGFYFDTIYCCNEGQIC